MRRAAAPAPAPAERILRRHGLQARRSDAAGRVTFTVSTRGSGADELPWTREVAADLRREQVPVVMYPVP